jgi:DNA polymerase III subunit alpha
MIFEEFSNYDFAEPAGVELPKIFVNDDLLKSIDAKLTQSSSNNDILKSLVKKGIKEKGIDKLPNKKEYYDRAKNELDTFEELGFTDYILLNWDILDFCHRNNIPTGNGRGSAAGSLVLFLLKVTNVDPIINNLFFERFVSKNRAKKVYDKNNKEYLVGSLLPDVDSDISYDQRQRVISYIEEKHIGRTAKILTLNTFSAKLCIREAAKYFNEANEEDANFVSDLIPKLHGKVSSLEKAAEDSEQFANWVEKHPLAFENAIKIENLNKNTGVHPSGIAICSQDIGNVSPLQKTNDGEIVTGYSMDDVSDLMVKFDILGLRTLTIAFNTCNKIGISLDDIDVNDPFIYQVLQDFKHPIGLFQISADTNFRVAQELKPDNLEELSDIVALARPGALQFVSDYKEQKSTPTFLNLHPELDEILSWSKNVILYQEQLMQIANKVFGLSLEEAETLRRIVGKKKVKEMGPWKEKIFEAGRKLKLEEKISEFYWNALEASADYSFNKSHSVAYAILAAKTVYLKYKYPQAFFTSVLESAESEPDPLATVYAVNQELKDFGIKLLQPSLEKSEMGFTIEGLNIRYGLNSIKGISSKSLQALVDFRGKQFNNKYEVFAAAKDVGINISVLAALIQAGAMPDSGENRTLLVLEAQAFNLLTEREKRNFCKIGDRFGFNLLKSVASAVEEKTVGDDNKLIMPAKRFETFKRNFEKYREIYLQNKKHKKFAKWWYENTLLGYSYSHNLKDAFEDDFGVLLDMREVQELGDREKFITVGQVSESSTRTSANGNKYMSILAGDDFLSSKFLMMDNRRSQNLTAFQETGAKIKKGDILIFTGSKSGDTLFLDSIQIVDTKIYMKLNDIKNDKITS